MTDERGSSASDQQAHAQRKSRSTAMIVLGLALFVAAFVIRSTNPDGGWAGAVLFGVLGVGLLVGGLVLRP